MVNHMRLGIIGTGRVGASFLLALRDTTGIDIVGITASTAEKSKKAAAFYAVTAYADGAALLADCDVVLLTVQDNAIATVSQNLAAALGSRKVTGVVLHCSGAMDLQPLGPLAAHGLAVGSLHPLQSIAKPDGKQLRHIFFALDGDDAARKQASVIVQALDSTAFTVPAAERPLYHCAACFASNYVVTAVAIAQHLLSRWTATPEDAKQALWPLLAGTMHNIEKSSLARTALTGPISRGDTETVTKHLALLPPEYQAVYRTLSEVTAMIAQENKTLTTSQYEELLSILRKEKEISHE